jgi:hypothetical protein
LNRNLAWVWQCKSADSGHHHKLCLGIVTMSTIQQSQISTYLESWRMSSAAQSLRLMMMQFKEWELGYMSRTQHGTNKAYIHLLCWHRATDVEGNFVEKTGCGVTSSLFMTCNLCKLWINIYWEKITGITFWATFKQCDSKWWSSSGAISCRQISWH